MSRAPLGKLQAYKRWMGWSLPLGVVVWSDFSYDFQVAYTFAPLFLLGVYLARRATR